MHAAPTLAGRVETLAALALTLALALVAGDTLAQQLHGLRLDRLAGGYKAALLTKNPPC